MTIFRPHFFSIFINDLAEQIKETKVGINLNENVINDDCKTSSNDLFLNILLYADDICLMTTNENDLQFLLNIALTRNDLDLRIP